MTWYDDMIYDIPFSAPSDMHFHTHLQSFLEYGWLCYFYLRHFHVIKWIFYENNTFVSLIVGNTNRAAFENCQ